MQITVLEVVNGSTHEKDTIANARSLLETVVGSDIFRQKFLAATLTETLNLTNSGVLQSLDSAVVSITVWMYYRWWTKVIGYTYFKTNTIYVNRKFFGGPVSVASNLGHEICHILGFPHDKVWATSVPYTFNRIFEETVLELKLG